MKLAKRHVVLKVVDARFLHLAASAFVLGAILFVSITLVPVFDRVGYEITVLFIRLNSNLSRVSRLDGIPDFPSNFSVHLDGKLVCPRIHIRRASRLRRVSGL